MAKLEDAFLNETDGVGVSFCIIPPMSAFTVAKLLHVFLKETDGQAVSFWIIPIANKNASELQQECQ